MKFEIYQIASVEKTEYSFMSWEWAKNHGFDFSHYKPIYSGEREDHKYILEFLFEEFNLHHPRDFKGHSLSVSDIVALNEGNRKSYHYCDSFGWQNVTDVISK